MYGLSERYTTLKKTWRLEFTYSQICPVVSQLDMYVISVEIISTSDQLCGEMRREQHQYVNTTRCGCGHEQIKGCLMETNYERTSGRSSGRNGSELARSNAYVPDGTKTSRGASTGTQRFWQQTASYKDSRHRRNHVH